jgi:short-subunit dehydrogenase
MSQQELNNKVVWITGASSGIGKSLAELMARDGYKVAMTARSDDALNAMADGERLFAYKGDVTDGKAMAAICAKIIKDHGTLDIAVLNAGTYLPDGMEDFSAAQLAKQYNINVNGTANCLEPVLKYFKEKKSGHVAIVASVAGYRGLPRSVSYGSTKAALINMAESLAAECKASFPAVKVQIVNPGFVKTPLTDANDFDMPMLMDVDKAAIAFLKGLKSSRFEVTFPWAFAFMTKLTGRILPNGLYIWLVSRLKTKQNEA